MRIIIDCDPGHDDAVAILMAFARDLDIRAITTVCGNNTLDNMIRNAHIVAAVAKRDVTIAAGAEAPLINAPYISSEFHGESGMDGPAALPDVTPASRLRCAVEVLKEEIERDGEKLTIVAIGPLTNIALLLKTYPHLKSGIERIVLMGGGLQHGNITEYAEFNIFVDPEAAHIVFASGLPIVMCGLDVTEKAIIHAGEFEYLRSRGTVGRFFCELMDFYGSKSVLFGATGCMLHDPCAVAYLLHPELFSGTRMGIEIELVGEERGRTKRTQTRNNVLCLNAVNREAFSRLVCSSIEKLAETVV